MSFDAWRYLQITERRRFVCPSRRELSGDVKRVVGRVRGRERIINPIENTWDNFLNGSAFSEDLMSHLEVLRYDKKALSAPIVSRLS